MCVGAVRKTRGHKKVHVCCAGRPGGPIHAGESVVISPVEDSANGMRRCCYASMFLSLERVRIPAELSSYSLSGQLSG